MDDAKAFIAGHDYEAFNRKCESYYNTFKNDLDTVHRTLDCLSWKPPTVDPKNNVVTHLCCVNFDLKEETPSGAGTTHTAHGIIIQEVSGVYSQTTTAVTSDVERSKCGSIQHVAEQYEP